MSEFECPFCHHTHEGRAPVDLLAVLKPSRLRRKIVDRLISAYPDGLTFNELRVGIYCSEQVLSNLLTDIRRTIKPLGWTIPNIRREDSNHRYRLSPIEEARRAA